MKTRREFLIAGAAALCVLAAPLRSIAQQRTRKIPRIGILNSESASDFFERSRVEALREGLRELGYEEGKSIVIEFRWAEGRYERLPDLASELARLKVDVLVTVGIKAALAAKRVTTTIPIVLPATSSDVVAIGLVASLSRPGGNITGSAAFGPEIIAKRLELLKEGIPHITRVGILVNPVNFSFGPTLQTIETTARSLKLSVHPFEVKSPSEFETVFLAMARNRVEAILVQDDTLFTVNRKLIIDLAAKRRLPLAGNKTFGEDGSLIGYGVNLLDMYRSAAVFVDKILKGANPGELPFERATKFELVINLRTAKSLGIKIPQSILVRADRVIE